MLKSAPKWLKLMPEILANISHECGMELNANYMLHDTVSCTSVASLFQNRHHKQLNVVRSLSPFI
jgi:hypothetical protein